MNRGDTYKLLGLMVVVLIFGMSFASASVGVGLSPSKMREHLTSGQSYTYDILVFNTGSDNMDITLSATGEIAEFVEIVENKMIVFPEPNDELPIENGRTFKVVINAPRTGTEKIFKGKIVATGSGAGDSQFGGNVAVSSQIELVVTPSKSIFAKLNTIHYVILGLVLFIILMIVLIRKSGIKISFDKN